MLLLLAWIFYVLGVVTTVLAIVAVTFLTKEYLKKKRSSNVDLEMYLLPILFFVAAAVTKYFAG